MDEGLTRTAAAGDGGGPRRLAVTGDVTADTAEAVREAQAALAARLARRPAGQGDEEFAAEFIGALVRQGWRRMNVRPAPEWRVPRDAEPRGRGRGPSAEYLAARAADPVLNVHPRRRAGSGAGNSVATTMGYDSSRAAEENGF